MVNFWSIVRVILVVCNATLNRFLLELNFLKCSSNSKSNLFLYGLFYIKSILDKINCNAISINKYIYFYFSLYFKDFFEVLSLRICLRVWPTLFIAINDIVIEVNTPWLRSNIIIGYCRSICYFTLFQLCATDKRFCSLFCHHDSWKRDALKSDHWL